MASSTSTPQRKYNVFLSFRGEDVRQGFIKDLDKKLSQSFHTFMDDRELKKGNIIDEALKLAIEQSSFSIVVVSENYAESPWCLRELAHIVQCMQESGRIMPIFYKVDPKDVRHQTGKFAQHFTEHEKKYGKDGKQVREWKDALTQLGYLSGWDSTKYSNDENLIEAIDKSVSDKINRPKVKESASSEKPVGGVGKLKNIDHLLSPEENDVRIIGIWGTDATGNKITAEFVCNRNSDKFEVSRILSGIKTNSLRKGLVYLQTNLLKDLLNLKSIEVPNVGAGKEMIKEFVRGRKVLLILDDMDQRDQLKILGGDTDWYDKGSRIIVTSTDKELLLGELGIEERFLVEGLTKDEARECSN